MAEQFKVYYHVLENEQEKFHVYYSYYEGAKSAIRQLESSLERELYIYDVFPNFDNEIKPLTSPLSVITKSQKEMFLPVGIEVELIGCTMILFGYKDESS